MKALFYPDPPIQLPGHSLSKTIKYFKFSGYSLTNDINDDWDVAVHWSRMDEDKIRCVVPKELVCDPRPVFNVGLNDISKSYVDRVFTGVFGYSSMADTAKRGFCVQKSEKQSAHDGKIIKTPCEREDGFIYQILIDNRMAVDRVYDVRVPFFMGMIPEVFIKTKTVTGTFEHSLCKNEKYWMSDISEWLTDDEIKKTYQFCELVGLDIGELDILRDNSTGKLYIIDLNHTPGGTIYDRMRNGREIEERLLNIFKKQLEKLIKIKAEPVEIKPQYYGDFRGLYRD